MNLSADGYVAESSRIARGQYEFFKRIFEVFGVRNKCLFAVGENGYRFAFLRGYIKFALNVIEVKPVLFGFDFHAEIVSKAHNGEIAKHVILTSARNSVQHDFVRAEIFLGVIHGKFAVACILVGVVLDDGDIDIRRHLERVEVAEYYVGIDRAYAISAVAAYNFVGFDFALDLCSAVKYDCNFHNHIISQIPLCVLKSCVFMFIIYYYLNIHARTRL